MPFEIACPFLEVIQGVEILIYFSGEESLVATTSAADLEFFPA